MQKSIEKCVENSSELLVANVSARIIHFQRSTIMIRNKVMKAGIQIKDMDFF